MAHYSKQNYTEAREAFIKSNELKNSVNLEYLIATCEALIITTRIGAFVTLTEDEVNRLREVYSKVSTSEVEKYFKERRRESVTDYWLNRLTILIHLDVEKALEDYSKMPKLSKRNPNVQLIYADLLYRNGDAETSYEILRDLYDKHKKSQLLLRILDRLADKDEASQILKITSALTKSEFDEEGAIGARILEAAYKEHGIDIAREKADEFLTFHERPVFIHYTLGNILAKEKSTESAREHFEKAIASIKQDNYPPRSAIAERCLRYEFVDLAVNCLKPFIAFNEDAKRRYVEIVLQYDVGDQKDRVSELIEQELEEGQDDRIDFWLNAKANLDYSEGRKRGSLEYLKKLFKKKPSPEIANNIVGLKIDLNEPSFQEYAKILEKQEDPNYLMMAAICYRFDGNKNLVDDLSYKALAKNGDRFDEILFTQYTQLHFFPSAIYDDKVELEKVERNSSIHLTGKEENVWITIESDKSLFADEDELIFVGAVHYSSDDEKVIRLRERKVNDPVTFQGKEYLISSIITKKAKAVQYCLQAVTSRNPDSPFFKSVQVTSEDPITPILPQLVALEKHKEELFAHYNLEKNDLGLPLWTLAKEFNGNLLDAILGVMSTPKQQFFAGEVKALNLSKQKIVLSPVSITLLCYFNGIDSCNKFYDNIYITESTRRYFKQVLDYIIDVERDSKGSLGIKGGKPFFQEATDEIKLERRGFFERILDKIGNFRIEHVSIANQEFDRFSKLIDIIGLHDFESMKLAKELKAFYVADDLFLRKVHNNLNQTNKSSNSIAVLFNSKDADATDAFLGKLLDLSTGNYLFLFNSSILVNVIKQTVEKHPILGPGTSYETFDKLLRNSLNTKFAFHQYEPILLTTLNQLYETQMTRNYEYFMQRIIELLKIHYSAYGLDLVILRGKLRSLTKIKTAKEAYFEKIFDNV